MKAILSMALVLACHAASPGAADKVDPVGTCGKCGYEIGGQKRMSTLTIKKDSGTISPGR